MFLFSSGPLGDPPRNADETADARAVEASTGALDQRVFAGRLTPSQLDWPERLIVRVVRAPYGDFRPWDDIAEWAREISRQLSGQEVVVPAEVHLGHLGADPAA